MQVPDLASALSEYQPFLGTFQREGGIARLPLGNVAIELVANPDLDSACLAGISLWAEEPVAMPEDQRGLALAQQPGRSVAADATRTGIQAVDHIVLRTRDADDCIRLFNRDLGMRLALDQSVPEWGGRMLFFRSGKLTLEVIQSDEPPEEDFFWGITYLCPDLDATLAALDAAGVTHSGNRLGRKPGTRVATVKSHTLGIPTLLIGPDS